jgi:3-hydroxyisobutyrate dehydrogenase
MAIVGWIGLGNMGGPMSANMVKAGHDVRGFDLSPAALEAAEKAGVHTVGSIAEAVDGAEVVFTMLPKG